MGCFCARTVSRGQFVGGVELHFGDGFRPVGAAAKASGHAFFKIFPSDHHLSVGSGLEVVLQADALGKGLRGIAIDNRHPARNNCINKRIGSIHHGCSTFPELIRTGKKQRADKKQRHLRAGKACRPVRGQVLLDGSHYAKVGFPVDSGGALFLAFRHFRHPGQIQRLKGIRKKRCAHHRKGLWPANSSIGPFHMLLRMRADSPRHQQHQSVKPFLSHIIFILKNYASPNPICRIWKCLVNFSKTVAYSRNIFIFAR